MSQKRSTTPEHISAGNPTEQSALQVARLVAAREILSKLRDRTFIISTAVLLVIVAASVVVPLLFSPDYDRPESTLAVVAGPAEIVATSAKAAGAEAIRLAEKRDDELSAEDIAGERLALRTGESPVPPVDLTVQPVATRAEAEALVRSEAVDAALIPASDGTPELVGLTQVDIYLSQLIALSAQSEEVLTGLQSEGIAPERARQLLATQTLQERLLDPPAPNADISQLLGFAFAALFFITSFSFGLLIAQSVVEEKQSRVIELLVAAIPVRLLLIGKVGGNTLLALGQVTLLLGVGLAGASIAGQGAAASLLLSSGGWFLLFFAAGFSMLSCLWAAAGALCSRQEDLQATTAPMQLLLGIPFFTSVYITEPGTWLTALSYIPFSAPLSMPRRLLLGDALWWEPVLALIGMFGTGALLVLLSARLYQGALLRSSGRTSIRTAWAGVR